MKTYPILGKKVDLKTGLISVWELDETSGTVGYDSHGSYDGNYVGAVDNNQTGILDKCVYLDTNDESIDIGVIDITAWTAISISVWFKVNDWANAANSRLFSIYSGSHPSIDDIRIFINSSGQLLFAVDDGTAYTTTAYSLGTSDFNWHNAVLTFNGSTLTGYVDGSFHDDLSASFDFSSADGHTMIGNTYLATQTKDYYADQTSLWNIALSQEQVTRLNNSMNGLAYSSW